MPPSILAPAPCLPALVRDGQVELDVLIACDHEDVETLRAWAAPLALLDVTTAVRVPLQVEAATRINLQDVPDTARGASLMAAGASRSLARLRLRIRGPIDAALPRRSRVFHLVRDKMIVRPRCVASWRAARSSLKIAFASDLHIAAIWDDIADGLEKYAPDLAPRLLHPSRLFDGLMQELTALAHQGEVDVLVLGGDLVDHVYRRRSGGETNAALLLDSLAALPVPVFAIPGNHDFRPFPWRARIYPFVTAGIPRQRARQALRQAGLWDPWPINPRDLVIVRADDDATSGLGPYLAAFASAADYSVDLDDLRLVFLSTGRDVVPLWRHTERGRIGLFLRSLPTAFEHPNSEGFSATQLAGLATTLAGCRNAALFFHAPIFNPRAGSAVDERLQRLDPGDDESAAANVRFEHRLYRSGHRHGVFFRNPAPFVRTLSSFRGGLTTFSGHVHATHAIEVDPGTMAVRSVAIERAHSNGVHTLLNAPALGQTATRDGEPPGYLLASFDGGRMSSVRRCSVVPSERRA